MALVFLGGASGNMDALTTESGHEKIERAKMTFLKDMNVMTPID